MFLCKQIVYTSSRVDRGMLHDKPAHTDTSTSFPSVAVETTMENWGSLMIHTSPKYSSKSRVQHLLLFILCCCFLTYFFMWSWREVAVVTEACVPRVSFCFASALALNAKKKRERESEVERGKGEEGERHIWKKSEEEWARERKKENKEQQSMKKQKGPGPVHSSKN